MIGKLTMAIVLCGFVPAAFAQSSANQDAVRQASAKLTAALTGGDVATAAAMFSEDAVLLPPGRPEMKGSAAIQRFLGNMTRGVQNLQYSSQEITPIGDAVVREVGDVAFKTKVGKNGKPSQDVSGKFLVIWQKSSAGDWKIAADMWNRIAAPKGAGGAGMGSKPAAEGVEEQ